MKSIFINLLKERREGGKEGGGRAGERGILTFHKYTSEQRKLPQIRGPSFKTGSQDTSKT